jgi:hypothetical protein
MVAVVVGRTSRFDRGPASRSSDELNQIASRPIVMHHFGVLVPSTNTTVEIEPGVFGRIQLDRVWHALHHTIRRRRPQMSLKAPLQLSPDKDNRRWPSSLGRRSNAAKPAGARRNARAGLDGASLDGPVLRWRRPHPGAIANGTNAASLMPSPRANGLSIYWYRGACSPSPSVEIVCELLVMADGQL